MGSDQQGLDANRADARDRIDQSHRTMGFARRLIKLARDMDCCDHDGRLSYILASVLSQADDLAEIAERLIEEAKSLAPDYIPF